MDSLDIKIDPLDRSEQKSRFNNISNEDTFDIFGGLLKSDSEDGDEDDLPSIAPATSCQ
jgi:hypothetical protein